MALNMRRIKVLYCLGATLLTSALLACGGGGAGGSSAPPTVQSVTMTFVSGTVKDSAGALVPGAVVSAGGQSATTGADGTFKLEASASADVAVVLVKKPGFTTTAKEVPLTTGSNSQIDIALFADQVITSFSAATAANVAVGAAQVQIPANGIKTANGADYTGTVNVGASYYSPDTLQGAQAFAGPYTGTDAGVQSAIISMGFMEVKLTDDSGNPLQLKLPATLTFPAASNSANAASVPLWFYDEAAAIWKREGAATRQADGTYQGTVAHFTIWNADFKGVNATLKGCIKNAAGQPVANAGNIGLRGIGFNRSLFLRVEDQSGNFTILNTPANMPLELYSAASPAAFAPVAIPALAAGEIRTLSPCITATATMAGAVTVVSAPTTPFTVTVAPTTPTTPTVTVTVPVGTTMVPGTTTVPATSTVPTTTTLPVNTTTVPLNQLLVQYQGTWLAGCEPLRGLNGTTVAGSRRDQVVFSAVDANGNVSALNTSRYFTSPDCSGSVAASVTEPPFSLAPVGTKMIGNVQAAKYIVTSSIGTPTFSGPAASLVVCSDGQPGIRIVLGTGLNGYETCDRINVVYAGKGIFSFVSAANTFDFGDDVAALLGSVDAQGYPQAFGTTPDFRATKQ